MKLLFQRPKTSVSPKIKSQPIAQDLQCENKSTLSAFEKSHHFGFSGMDKKKSLFEKNWSIMITFDL